MEFKVGDKVIIRMGNETGRGVVEEGKEAGLYAVRITEKIGGVVGYVGGLMWFRGSIMTKEKIKEWKKYNCDTSKEVDLTFSIDVEEGKYIVKFTDITLSDKIQRALKAIGTCGYEVDMSGSGGFVCTHELGEIIPHTEVNELGNWEDVERYIKYISSAITKSVNGLLFDFVSFQEEEADKLGIYHMEI